jgi:hypothetical protein
MAYAAVASTSKVGTSTGVTSDAIDTSGASLLIIVISYLTAPTVSDSKGNTWTPVTAVGPTSGGNNGRMYYAAGGITVGSGHTFTVSGAASFSPIAAAAYSGADSSPFEAEGTGATGTNAAPSAATGVTPAEDNELVIAWVALGVDAPASVSSIDGGFTIRQSVQGVAGVSFGLGLADLIQTSGAAADPTWTLSANESWATNVACFTAAAAAAGNPWYSYAQQRRRLEEREKLPIRLPGFAEVMRYGRKAA